MLVGGTAVGAAAAGGPGRSQCIAELGKAGVFTKDVNPGKANIIVGTEGDDTFGTTMDDPGQLTDGVDLGNDFVSFPEGGTFNGGAGDDSLAFLNSGTFNGGEGNERADFVNDGVFNGDAGDDHTIFLFGGTSNGGPGDDVVDLELGGTFNQ